MYPITPLRNYGTQEFMNFNIPSFSPFITRDAVLWILSDIANEVVSKANTNIGRMYVHNTLAANGWYNQSFVQVATDIVAIICGRTKEGVDTARLNSEVIANYLSCYTSYCIIMNRELKGQVPSNLVAAAEQNAVHYNEFKQEAIKVMNMNQQPQMYPQNAQMYPQQPMMQQMPMQQPMMYPGMYPQQPMMQQMPMQQPMVQPAFGQPMMQQPSMFQQQMIPQQSMVQQGFMVTGQMYPQQINDGTTTTSKFDRRSSPSAYGQVEQQQQAEPVIHNFTNHHSKYGHSQAVHASPVQQTQEKPKEELETKVDEDKTIVRKSDSLVANIHGFTFKLETATSSSIFSADMTDKRYYHNIQIAAGSLNDAMFEVRGHQITEQGHSYTNMAFGSPVSFVNQIVTTVDLNTMITEVILTPDVLEVMCHGMQLIYNQARDTLATRGNADATAIEIYEQYKFIKRIDDELTNRLNDYISYQLGSGATIGIFSEDAITIVDYLNKKGQTEDAKKVAEYTLALFNYIKQCFSGDIFNLINESYQVEPSKGSYNRNYLTSAYVASVPISKDTYTLEEGKTDINDTSGNLYYGLNLLFKHAEQTSPVFDLYIFTLDNEAYQVIQDKQNQKYILKKVA
jgi:hypothetical protein